MPIPANRIQLFSPALLHIAPLEPLATADFLSHTRAIAAGAKVPVENGIVNPPCAPALRTGRADSTTIFACEERYPPRIRADETLEDVLSCLRNSDSFESLMRECLFHGGDTETICAVAGPLGEALWGTASTA
ncbi:ADP-ribosylglycohydrolase family protein [Trinickia violacea]|uniref:ADP-ribosylglycohydrolase family protein n=1 Tax=Trinickia violacea TaxID=2571746 RepID=A0A4P8IJC4_9BURK|nr:ADP-ribosylglycohydrolase family protein [Trinickia violacea]QCP48276.1 ADP-ribosylglycohydrolase family protein [Trinickia violacea]